MVFGVSGRGLDGGHIWRHFDAMSATIVNTRFPLPLENDQRTMAETIARQSGHSMTTVLKLAITLGLPGAQAAMCPPTEVRPITDAERAAALAAMTEEELADDRRLGAASLAAQRGGAQ
jgi:hypothetical protein